MSAPRKAPDKLVTIATCNGVEEAHILQSRLNSEGIWSVVFDEYTASTIAGSFLTGGIKLQVRDSDADRAAGILSEGGASADEPASGASAPDEPASSDAAPAADESDTPTLACPKCGSTDVADIPGSDKSQGGSFWGLFNLKPRWKCSACSHSWR